jgi:hypothetical protein
MTPSRDEVDFLDDFINNNAENNKSQDILMKISFSVINDETNAQDCAENLQSYVASFPFAAVLPVQPLTYTPRAKTNDGRHPYPGVSVTFLRKKTKEKGEIDGGIEFLISVDDSKKEHGDNAIIQLLAVRNTEGQTVSKVFSEGLIIKSFVSGLLGDHEDDGARVGIGKDSLLDCLSIKSCIHKWM